MKPERWNAPAPRDEDNTIEPAIETDGHCNFCRRKRRREYTIARARGGGLKSTICDACIADLAEIARRGGK